MHRAGIGHLIGLPAIDRFWLRQLGLDASSSTWSCSYDVDLRALADQVWPDAARRPIWNRLGYCLIHPDPDRSPTHDESFLTRIFP